MSDDHEHGHEHEQDAPWELSEDEQKQVLALPPRERYGLFLQVAADWEEVWGLYTDDGWVLSSIEEGQDILPLWPHPAFAQACAHGSWEGTEPAPIALDELLEDLLAILEEDGIRIAVFLSPDGEGVGVTPEELRRDLKAEMELGE
jgi:hypothetical protein